MTVLLAQNMPIIPDVSNATATYTDADGEMTTIGSYTTKYSIDANNGKVTVDSGTGTGK
ncbi:hypothetical protein, partial [Escherichia coli]|uniref:hypothetical protein n=1 Tax=Escherichia coli TaxID=562 RepID=UPI00288A80A2